MSQSYSVNGVHMDLDTSEAIQAQMALGTYEPTESEWVLRHLGPGSVFVDVGANFGWFTTLALSLVGSSGHVYAFEPSPVAFATLRRSLGSRGNVTLINAAVGRELGEVSIYLPNSGPVHSPSVFESPGDFRSQRVPMVSLDRCEALNDVPVIDMVKIDVEGSEPDVVEGMKGLIAAGRVRRVICEFNSVWLKINNTSVNQLADQFQELGFEAETSTPWQTGPTSDGGQFHVQDVLYRHRSAPRFNHYFAKARALFSRRVLAR
jgi:FkbM family methyltransferase